MTYLILALPLYYTLTYVNWFIKLIVWLCLFIANLAKCLERVQTEMLLAKMEKRNPFSFGNTRETQFLDGKQSFPCKEENELIAVIMVFGWILGPILEIFMFIFFPNVATTFAIYQSKMKKESKRL